MATKSKLEQAIEKQVESLNDAQKELVKSQLAVYKRNNSRLQEVESELKALNATRTTTLEEVRSKQALRASLAYEQNQLATSNSRIASELFEFMKED